VVSIATDQVQGMATVLIAVVISIYLAVTFRRPILEPLPSYAAGDPFDLVSTHGGWHIAWPLGLPRNPNLCWLRSLQCC